MKKTISVILSVLMVFLLCVPAFAADAKTAELYNIYGDNMIFEQNAPVVLSGTAVPGTPVSAVLADKNGNTVSTDLLQASADGTFSLTLPGEKGSYDEYTITLYENGKVFEKLDNVVFGEVWLASGQSNMQYPLSQDKDGAKLFEEKTKLDPMLRVMLVPALTKYKGSLTEIPYEPQNNIEEVKWVTGENYAVYEISAVAYWFADNLRKELDMPVGIINSALGGSSIMSWLSRQSIEENEYIKQALIDTDKYYSEDNWYGREFTQAFDMTGNYNLKIYPLRHFTCAGMIWYQGETDCMFDRDYGVYSEAVNCLQDAYSGLLAKNGEKLPFIFTSLAAYDYGDVRTSYDMNVEFSEIQKADAASRALTAIYDVSLDYIPEVGAIHPSTKQPVGKRMAHSAMGFIYGNDDTYTAAAPVKTEIKASEIYITFGNTGKGLTSAGAPLSDFTICGTDGIYLPAKAEIVSSDTVKVYAENVPAPVSVAYAYSNSSSGANLFAESENGYLMPAAAFVTDRIDGAQYVKFIGWMDCENENMHRVITPSEMTGFYPTWTSKDSEIKFNSEAAFDGGNGLHISSCDPLFTVNPMFSYHRYLRDYFCSDIENNISNYGTLSFMVKNNGTKAVEISTVRFYVSDTVWYAPETTENSVSYTVPADGEWHKVTYDLNTLHQWGSKLTAAFGNEKLSDIRNIKLCFRNTTVGKADICLDGFSFTSDGKEVKETRYSFNKLFDRMIEILAKIFIKFNRLIYK